MYQIVTALNDTSVFDLNGPNHVTLWENNRGDHQKWKFVYNRDKNAYQIKSVSDKNLVLAWNAIPNSKQVFATPNQYKEEHYWILEECKDGYYIIKNKKDPTLFFTPRTSIQLVSLLKIRWYKIKLKANANGHTTKYINLT
ncbi:RICIN domain-containing protein [Paenibacillus larvae]|uniref:RICIN domain-containing protein n=3 Tax=Paenibacillus larvae TaxID=1464 RepID=UPI00391727FA